MWVVHRTERADRLADALAEVIGGPAADPFVPEIVAVPERGVERWLGQRLAHRLGTVSGSDGVCANVLFPAPGQVLAEAVDAATGTDPESDPWHPARAVWPLLEEVVAAVEAPGETFAALAAHLSQSGGSRTYAVARRLADLFAGYAVHRPDMLRAWWAGSPEGVPEDLRWQVELWRRLRVRIGGPGPAERLEQAERALRADPGLVELPDRLSVFGPTRLAAEHLAVLSALAEHREVHLWLPHPSPALWEKLSSAQGAAVPRKADRSADEVVNPLLRSLGRDVRELQLRLPVEVADVHHPAAPAPATLLGRLQEGLREDRLPAGELPLLDPADRSVQVHACHGPDRQVEVLREIVLGLLAVDETLEPRDVIVMCPDIEAFAPLISASFGLAATPPDPTAAGTGPEDTHPGHRLRVRLADRALRQANPLLGTVSALLELADSRVAASQVLDLVGSAPVRRRFRLDDDALDRIGELVVRAGVRWGLDGEHRRPFKLDGFPQNTWSAGLDRMLLGVAMAERPGEQGWLGTALPLDDVDSSDVDLVGSLAEILDRLHTTLDALAGPQPLTSWIAALLDGLSALTATTASEAWQAAQARAELAEVVRSAGPQGGTVPLTLSDVRGLLADRLRGRPSRANFRTGTLTVATLVPMRSVPHRVVCLLGVDDGVFPRTGAPDGDDVLARDPRVGERDPRSEDRQLLLDAITAATEHLVVVHSGMNERTGADRPPAVPIGELLDAVDATVRVPCGRASDAITVRHPLQPFDPRNFTPELTAGPAPFSFDRNSLAGARALQGERRPAPPFLAAPLTPAETGDTVELDDLVRFLEHPMKAFLRQRVGMVPRSEDEEPADALPVSLGGLDEWAVGNRMLRDRLAGAPAEQCVQAEWRRGELPPGALGGAVLEKVGSAVEPLVEASVQLRAGEPVSRDVAADLGGLRVVGTVAGLYGATLVTVEYSRLGPKHRLRAWARLLALTVTRPDTGWRAVTLGRGRGGGAMRATIRPLGVDEAKAALADLVALHREGLREPLPVSTPCTAAYAKARRAGASARDAELAAAREWTFEKEDEAIVAVLGADPEFERLLEQPGNRHGGGESRFGELAERIWRPLLDAEHVELL